MDKIFIHLYFNPNGSCGSINLAPYSLQGAKVLLGGKRHSLGMTFYEPTVITDVKNEMLISR